MDGQHVIKVERGTPTAEELAALVGVLLSRVPAESQRNAPVESHWVRSGRPGAITRGPGAWRAAALPR
ncbi:hypothetical protein GCM10023322_23950 [Rugosimonospora acidiphila]|uniref:Acyl-CoA carboxylase subunit epsilon n=1 Tax=Rugosimonospora acidiphila TaxID=556531 RepID=A0ABP9RPS4_9ACTN